MILNHRIRVIDGKEVLYIFFDFSYEFGKFGYVKEENILKKIVEYIKKEKIKFIGNTVLLCTSGIVFGTLFFNHQTSNIDLNYDEEIIEVQNISNEKTNIVLNEDDIYNKKENELEENIVNEKEVLVTKKEENITDLKQTNQVEIEKNINNKVIEKEDIVQDEELKKVEEVEDIVESVQFKMPVTIYRKNGEIITLELEDYLIGVVAAEMPASFNIEALKAGAVAARTYALKHISEDKKLTDDESTQSYIDTDEMKKLWGNSFNNYYSKIQNAVNSTEGIYMSYNGYYIDAVYHSTSNGYTVSAINVWGNDIPYLQSVESAWDINVSSYLRETNISLTDFNEKLAISFSENSIVQIIRDETNHVRTIIIDDNVFTGFDFRIKLGLRSTDFDIKLDGESVKIVTKGYGHGVGMSQYGANEMAKLGYTYEEILNHYYRNISILIL